MRTVGGAGIAGVSVVCSTGEFVSVEGLAVSAGSVTALSVVGSIMMA